MIRVLFKIIGLSVIVVACSGQDNFPKDTEHLMQYLAEDGKDFLGSPLSGAIVVSRNDSILFKGSFGTIGVGSEEAITEDTRFYIGSLSKQFTAVLVLKLAEEGMLDLHTPISEYLPIFPSDKGNRITIHHLLSNTSGLPHYIEVLKFGYSKETFFEKEFTTQEYVDLIGKMYLVSSPGESFHYSSFGYILLGAIIEEVTGKSFGKVLLEKIALPLRLKNTGYSNSILRDNIAQDKRYIEKTFGKNGFEEIPNRELSTAFSAGGIYSSLNDLQIWIKAIRIHEVLSPEYQHLLFAPNEHGYCYGFFRNPEELLRKDQNAQLYFHGGSIMGYRSAMAMYDDGTDIITLMNSVPLVNPAKFLTQIHLSTLGQNKPSKKFINPRFSSLELFNEEGGLEAFYGYHEKLSEIAGYTIYPSPGGSKKVVIMHLEDPDYVQIIKKATRGFISKNSDLSEELINSIGYAYLEKKEFEEAESIFKENIKRYPKSANVYDSYGELLEKMKRNQEAKIQYEKAVNIAKNEMHLNLELFQKNLRRVSD
ncbi:MAG: serine hydrolase [Bacteroidota bacterium]